MLEVGQVLDGKYKILNKVGQGGMSVVYLAMNERANKQWAVKEVRKDGTLNFEAVKQGLIAETDILKRIKHPHLPSIADIIDTDDSFIIIMDYIQGNSLDKAIRDFGPQPEEAVIDWAKQLCDVLGYLHSLNPPIIYRDMKPANVMLQPDTSEKYPYGEISLIDFGTAREYKNFKAEDTKNLGTLDYAAPEQFGGNGQTDARTDIFALGRTIYHLVTGLSPRSPQTEYEMKPIRQINPQLSSGLEKIIIKCTQQNRNDRYQTCAELLYDLEHYKDLEDEYIKRQKNKLRIFAATAVMTVFFAAASVFGYISAESEKKANYNYKLKKASSVDDYYEVIMIDPIRTEAYLGTDDNSGLIQFLIDDEDGLSGKDDQVFTELKAGIPKTSGGYDDVVDVISQLKDKNKAGYEKVCNEIGEAYIFYYHGVNVEKDKYISARSWFKECSAGRYPMAEIYCEIADSLQNISKYKDRGMVSNLSKEYGDLWAKIENLYGNTGDLDDDLKFLVWQEITKMIDSNAKEFYKVSGKADVIGILDRISDDLDTLDDTFFEEDSLLKFKTSIEEVTDKVKSVEKSKSDDNAVAEAGVK